jgi:hypothetical protein
MAIRATDNEQYATELWGDNKRWDDDLKQFVPSGDVEDKGSEKGGDQSSPGNSTEPSSDKTLKNSEKSGTDPQSPVRTTESPSVKAPTGSSSASSTGGAGKAPDKGAGKADK